LRSDEKILILKEPFSFETQNLLISIHKNKLRRKDYIRQI